jgi:hypothetical protein
MAKAAKRKVRQTKADVTRARQAARERARKHREKLRAQGLRPIQMWVLDTRNPAVVAEIKRQCLLLREDPQEKQILQEIEAVADLSGWK